MEELIGQVRTLKTPTQVAIPVRREIRAASRWTDKEKAMNDRKLLRDDHIDALNPSYMYPDLGDPYKDRYLNHAKPPPSKWLNTVYDDIEDGFVPGKSHVYTQPELVALAIGKPHEPIANPVHVVLFYKRQ